MFPIAAQPGPGRPLINQQARNSIREFTQIGVPNIDPQVVESPCNKGPQISEPLQVVFRV